MEKVKVCFVAHKRYGIRVPEWIEETPINEAKLVVVFGGDGTLLRTARHMRSLGVTSTPIFGLNRGTVGFMANDVSDHNDKMYEMMIKHVLESHDSSMFEERSILNIEYSRGTLSALNEITVHPMELGRLLEIDMIVESSGDTSSVSMKGDGVIVSTATGSTAYNLSAGGPILMPHMEAMVVTPLNPFTMSARTIVLGKDDSITLVSKGSCFIVDGHQDVVGSKASNELKITLSQDKMVLVRMSSFFDAIQEKLGWNRSIK